MLAPLADVVAAELERVGVPKFGAHTSSFMPAPGPLELLRRAGRELDCAALPVVLVDGERGGFLTATCERTVIVEYPDGWREPVRLDRVQVEAGDVAWRDAVNSTWNNQTILGGGDPESRARGRARATQQRASRTPPPGYVTTGEALASIGLNRKTSTSTILRAIERGELHAVKSAEGRHFVKPADVETWNRTLRRRGQGSRTPGMKKAPAAAAASA